MAAVNYDLKNGTTSKKEEGRGGGFFFWKKEKDERKERSEELCSRELSYVCDLPLRLIGS